MLYLPRLTDVLWYFKPLQYVVHILTSRGLWHIFCYLVMICWISIIFFMRLSWATLCCGVARFLTSLSRVCASEVSAANRHAWGFPHCAIWLPCWGFLLSARSIHRTEYNAWRQVPFALSASLRWATWFCRSSHRRSAPLPLDKPFVMQDTVAVL